VVPLFPSEQSSKQQIMFNARRDFWNEWCAPDGYVPIKLSAKLVRFRQSDLEKFLESGATIGDGE